MRQGIRQAAAAAAGLVATAWLADMAVAAAQPAGPAPSPERGKQLYNSYCARCHGINMVHSGGAAFDLRTLGPDEHARFEHSVTQGLGAMPAWGSILKPEDIESLWTYVMAGK
jgi:cytochrome c55X